MIAKIAGIDDCFRGVVQSSILAILAILAI
jgi:hypothetical protein